MTEWTMITTAVIIITLIVTIIIFNQLVTNKNYLENAFAQIDVQLERRYDLIPNLVQSAKAYMQHEKSSLEAVIKARNNAKTSLSDMKADLTNPKVQTALESAELDLTSSLGQFNMLIEDYPELKADQTIADLMEELSSTENRLAFAKQAFNDAVMVYNTHKQTFPPILVAKAFGHSQDAQLFKIANKAEKLSAPKVQL